MLTFLVAVIAIILGFKFYPHLTKILLRIFGVGFLALIIIALIYNLHTNSNQPVSVQPTPTVIYLGNNKSDKQSGNNTTNQAWHTEYKYSNDISTSTDTFNIQSQTWMIIYSVSDPTNGSGMLTVYVDGSSLPVIFHMGAATNIRQTVSGSGQHYLTIDDTNNIYYTIKVLDYY